MRRSPPLSLTLSLVVLPPSLRRDDRAMTRPKPLNATEGIEERRSGREGGGLKKGWAREGLGAILV